MHVLCINSNKLRDSIYVDVVSDSISYFIRVVLISQRTTEREPGGREYVFKEGQWYYDTICMVSRLKLKHLSHWKVNWVCVCICVCEYVEPAFHSLPTFVVKKATNAKTLKHISYVWPYGFVYWIHMTKLTTNDRQCQVFIVVGVKSPKSNMNEQV